MLPDKFQWVMHVNPMAVIVEGFRSVMFYHTWPDFQWVLIWAVLSVLLVVVGYIIFKKLEKTFVEEL